MKKIQKFIKLHILSLAVVLILVCVSPACPALAETSGSALTVGVPTDRCPVFYKDADSGEVVGIGVDLMRLAAKEAGFSSVTFASIQEKTLKDAL